MWPCSSVLQVCGVRIKFWVATPFLIWCQAVEWRNSPKHETKVCTRRANGCWALSLRTDSLPRSMNSILSKKKKICSLADLLKHTMEINFDLDRNRDGKYVIVMIPGAVQRRTRAVLSHQEQSTIAVIKDAPKRGFVWQRERVCVDESILRVTKLGSRDAAVVHFSLSDQVNLLSSGPLFLPRAFPGWQRNSQRKTVYFGETPRGLSTATPCYFPWRTRNQMAESPGTE